MRFELLYESAKVYTVLQNVQQVILFKVTMFYVDIQLPEEGNKRFEVDERYGILNEQDFTLQECLSGTAVYQRLCRGVMKHDKPVNDDTKSEKNFSRTVEQSLHKLMLDDSTISHERQIERLSMERLEKTQFGFSPPRSVNVDDEMCSRANIGSLAGEIFDIPENLLFVCWSNYGS